MAAETYNDIFSNTLGFIKIAKGIYENYSESDFVYDLSEDNEDIKKNVMSPLQDLMDEMLRGTMEAALNRAVKLAKEKNTSEIDELFAAGEYFFDHCFDRDYLQNIINHIKMHSKLPQINYDDVYVVTE